jgi:predicted ABC-type transport system involved in lysophospholipase L1 biosynthesis ATPase subunit
MNRGRVWRHLKRFLIAGGLLALVGGVGSVLRRLGRERQAAVIVVTHDERMIEGFDRIFHMVDGRITGAH